MTQIHNEQQQATGGTRDAVMKQALNGLSVLKSGEAHSEPSLESCLYTLRNTEELSGQVMGLRVLRQMECLHGVISDVSYFDLDKAARFAQIASEQDDSFDEALLEMIRTGTSTPQQGIRILDILERICSKSRRLELLVELKTQEPRVRSKLVLMLGRLTHNSQWLKEQLMSENPRVRANAVEGFWSVRSGTAVRKLLHEAAADLHHRVAANAMLALYRLDDTESIPMLCNMLRHSDEMFRRAALWVVGQLSDMRFLPLVEDLLPTSAGEERAAAEQVIKQLARQHAVCQFTGSAPLMITENAVREAGVRYARFRFLPDLTSGSLLHPQVRANDFQIFENAKLIERYSFQQTVASENLTAVMVIPALSARMEELVRTGWQNLSASERLMLLPYGLPAGVLEKSSNGSSEWNIPFMNDVTAQVDSLRKQPRAAQNLETAIQIAVNALDRESGDRHLFLVADPLMQTPLSDFLIERIKHLHIKELMQRQDGTSAALRRRGATA